MRHIWCMQILSLFYFCVAYTNCKPRNAMAEDIYSCICHGEQSGCHMVYYHPVYAQLSYVSFQTQRVVEVRFLSSYSFIFAA